MGRCEQCGAEIPEEMPFGLCPACSLRAPEPEDQTEGPEIPGYEVVRALGRGGFGEVYECVQLDPAVRCVAVKILSRLSGADRRRLADEVQVLADLNHPGIARLLGTGELADGRPFYAMELCEGVPLDAWLREENPDREERVRVLLALAEAVAHVHRAGVAHRDLTPGNVLVSRTPEGRWRPKLIDFGLSRAWLGTSSLGREETLELRFAGTPMWMAPEQLEGGSVGEAADQHGLGLLLGLMLLDAPPLAGVIAEGADWKAWRDARTGWKWPEEPPLSRHEKPLRWIAEKATALHSGDRYASVEEFSKDLGRWLEGQPVEAGRHRRLYLAGRLLARHGKLLAALGGLALVAGAIALSDLAAMKSVKAAHREELSTQLARAEADRLLALAVAAMPEAADEAARLLERAAALDADNAEVAFSHAALRALAPEAEERPAIPLPFVAEKVVATGEGWEVTGFDGQRATVTPEGGVSSEGGTLTALRSWTNEADRWQAAVGEGGRLVFTDLDDGFPVMHPLVFSDGASSVAVSPERKQAVATTSEAVLRAWDLSNIGGTRERATFAKPVSWMAFERDASTLWMIHEDGRMRGWYRGDKPGFAGRLMAFSSELTPHTIGENHARGTRPGLDGAGMLLQLELWKRGGKGRAVRTLAGSRDIDHIAFAGSGGVLLWWTPEGSLAQWVTGLPEASVLAIDAAGESVLWVAEDGRFWWLDPFAKKTKPGGELGSTPNSATVLDGGRRAVIAGRDGQVAIWDRTSREPRKRLNLVGERPGEHAPLVYGCRGGECFLVALRGELSITMIDSASGERIGDALRFGRGIAGFFLDQTGRTLIGIDQDESGPGQLRLMSLRTRRDLIPPLKHPAAITWAVVSSKGDTLATACRDGSVRRWVIGE